MEYMVEISDVRGEGIATQEFCQFESTTPPLIPNVGDYIHLLSGCGLDGKQAPKVKVLKRLFTYHPKGQNSDSCVHVQLFCCDSNSRAES
jgi:hypothetical protein